MAPILCLHGKLVFSKCFSVDRSFNRHHSSLIINLKSVPSISTCYLVGHVAILILVQICCINCCNTRAHVGIFHHMGNVGGFVEDWIVVIDIVNND